MQIATSRGTIEARWANKNRDGSVMIEIADDGRRTHEIAKSFDGLALIEWPGPDETSVRCENYTQVTGLARRGGEVLITLRKEE